MPTKSLVRYLALVALVAAIVLGLAGSPPTDVRAATVVATLASGASGSPGNPDPNVEYLTPTNTWSPAQIIAKNGAWGGPLPGSQYIDVFPSATGGALSPVAFFRTPFTLPAGCISPSISVSLYADNWADVFLNGSITTSSNAGDPNWVGGQPHSALFSNFQAVSTFNDPPGPAFVNPGANWLYFRVENAPLGGDGGVPSANNPRGLDFTATVSCDQVVPPPKPTLVFECFQLDAGQDPNRTVMLDTDNFGKDIVTVRTSDIMCESALKYRQVPAGTVAAPPAEKEALQCFRIQQGQDPNDPAILDTSNFGPDRVRIRTSTRMCESAIKLRPQMPPFGDVPQPSAWQCFNLQDGDNPNAQVVLSTNNFGPQHVFVSRAVLMCETAAKYVADAAGNVQLSIPNTQKQVYECYRLVEAPNQAFPASLVTRNFGKDDVRIRRAVLMCEPAKKTILFANPNPNEPIPGAIGPDDNGD